MASYEVEPDLFENVSFQLVSEIRSRMGKEDIKDEEPADETEVSTANAVSEEAE